MIEASKHKHPRIYIAQTNRLRLRIPAVEDVEVEKVRCLSDRCRFEWRYMKPERCWPVLLTQLQQWKDTHMGTLAIDCKETGQYLGAIHLHQVDKDDGKIWELGWGLIEKAEGKGIAFEAAAMARSWFYTRVAAGTPIYTRCKKENWRSRKLIERLEGVYLETYTDAVFGEIDLWKYPSKAS